MNNNKTNSVQIDVSPPKWNLDKIYPDVLINHDMPEDWDSISSDEAIEFKIWHGGQFDLKSLTEIEEGVGCSLITFKINLKTH